MAEFCAANGISILPYGVVAGGLLSDRYLGLPVDKVRLDTYSKGKYARCAKLPAQWPTAMGCCKANLLWPSDMEGRLF